jgi:pimeloyl-ACP methyl ester carboxylesterase
VLVGVLALLLTACSSLATVAPRSVATAAGDVTGAVAGDNAAGNVAPTAADGDGDGGGADAAPARFEPGDCPFDAPQGYTVRCGKLVVEQNRDRPDGTSVRLQVGIFHKEGVSVSPDPLVYLDGGPGGNALQGSTTDFDRRFGGYAATRDVVVFDQRGTGYSEPRLDCPAFDALLYDQLDETTANAAQVDAQQDALTRCRADLVGKGVDLRQYNSVASAADVADLRLALGYPTWDVYGVSYGTRLAQTLLRTHPEGVRSVVLDSTYPVAADSLQDLPDQMQHAFDHLFAACRTDVACDARFPNLEARFGALVDRLTRTPVKVTATDFVTGDDHAVTVTGSDLQDLLFQALYDPSMFTAMPQVVEDLEAGRTASLKTLEGVSVTQLPFITFGDYITVQCHEEVPFADPGAVGRAVAAHPALAESIAGQLVDSEAGFETCRRWDAGTAPPEENQPVRSDVPTLVLSGGFDPITPGPAAEEVTRSLSRGTFVSFAGLGHGVALEAGCPQGIAVAFLRDPNAPLDTTCAAAVPPPRFAGPSPASEIRLEPFDEQSGGLDLHGVRPAGWGPAGPGAVARQRNVLDQTALVQQAARGVGPSDLVTVLSRQIPLDRAFAPDGVLDVGGTPWSRYRATLGGDAVDLLVGQRSGVTFMALLISEPDERDQLLSLVLDPAAAALRAQ